MTAIPWSICKGTRCEQSRLIEYELAVFDVDHGSELVVEQLMSATFDQAFSPALKRPLTTSVKVPLDTSRHARMLVNLLLVQSVKFILLKFRKRLKSLPPRKRRSFATGSMDLTLLRNENGSRSLKSGAVKSSLEKWLLLMASKC